MIALALLRYWREGVIAALLILCAILYLSGKAADRRAAKFQGQLAVANAMLDKMAEDHKAGQERQKRELEAARRQSKVDQPKIERLRESAGKPDVEGPCEISETLRGGLPL